MPHPNGRHRLHQAATRSVLLASLSIALSLSGCGLSKPGASDIEPYVMDALGQCQLWTIGDVRKVDGIEQGNEYRVDFTAKLTLKEAPEQAVRSYSQHRMDPNYVGCHR